MSKYCKFSDQQMKIMK